MDCKEESKVISFRCVVEIERKSASLLETSWCAVFILHESMDALLRCIFFSQLLDSQPKPRCDIDDGEAGLARSDF